MDYIERAIKFVLATGLILAACALYSYRTFLYAVGIGPHPDEYIHPTQIEESPVRALAYAVPSSSPSATGSLYSPLPRAAMTKRAPPNALRAGSTAYTIVAPSGYSVSQVNGSPGYYQLNMPSR